MNKGAWIGVWGRIGGHGVDFIGRWCWFGRKTQLTVTCGCEYRGYVSYSAESLNLPTFPRDLTLINSQLVFLIDKATEQG